jgi:hypothetical protein
MRQLKQGLIIVQSFILGAVLSLDILLMVLQQPQLDQDVTQYGIVTEIICFYLAAALFLIIIIALTLVDILLLKRLKKFYPGFYQKEKNKVSTF